MYVTVLVPVRLFLIFTYGTVSMYVCYFTLLRLTTGLSVNVQYLIVPPHTCDFLNFTKVLSCLTPVVLFFEFLSSCGENSTNESKVTFPQ